jgi:AcrR family transcriptional regulator
MVSVTPIPYALDDLEMPRNPRQPSRSGSKSPSKRSDTVSGDPPKPSHSERLLTAMTQLASGDGYAETSVADVIAQAGVSRQTFYECFADREDCFLAAYRQSAGPILDALEHAIDSSEFAQAPRAAVEAILAQIAKDPEGSWLFFVESLSGGARIAAEHERALGAFEQAAEGFLESAPVGELTLDVPPRALLGAIRIAAIRCIGAWHLNAEDAASLEDDLLAWISSYAVVAGQARWSTGPHALLPARTGRASAATPLLPRPGRLPRGNHGLPRGVVERNRRERIIHATAEAIQAEGYEAAQVAEIALAAGIGRDVLYKRFSDKRHLFLAAQGHAAQETFNACARAYFAQPTWPERLYAGLRALTQIIAAEPALAHLRIVAPYGAGPEAIERTLQMTGVYGAFLEEGYGYRPEAARLPRGCSTAIVDAVFEIIREQIAGGHASEMPRHVPQLAYIAIAPFTGPAAAAELIEGLAAEQAGGTAG